MAIFTGTPVLIDDIEITREFNFTGRFYYGGFEWIVGADRISGNDVVVKRTGASTWVTFDLGARSSTNAHPAPVIDTASGKLVIVGRLSTTLRTYTFDLTTETFSSVTTSSFTAGFDPLSAIRSNGDVRAIFWGGVGGDLFAVAITAGVLGIPILLVAGPGKLPVAMVCDQSTGIFHIGYRLSFPGDFGYVTLSASDTAGSSATISTDAVVDNCNARIYGDRIIFGESHRDPVRIFIGTPISAPVWTPLNLHPLTPGINNFSMTAIEQGGVLKFIYEHTDFSTVSELMQVTWDGATLGTPEVFWDALANPPGSGTPPFYLSSGLAGDFGTTLGIAVSSWDNTFTIYTMFLEVAASARNRARYYVQ